MVWMVILMLTEMVNFDDCHGDGDVGYEYMYEFGCKLSGEVVILSF